MDLVAFVVLSLLVIPPVVIYVVAILILPMILIMSNTQHTLRDAFRCPVAGRVVTADEP